MSLEDLGRRVAAEQDALLRTSDAATRVRERVARTPSRRNGRFSSSLRWGAVAVAIAAAATIVLLIRSREAVAPLTFEVSGEKASSGAWISTDQASVTAVRFSDGSIFALGEGARARVESVTADGAHVVMERGSVSADVVHRATSRWSVLAGPYEVHVTGTQFNVSWQPASGRIEVHVTRGSVVVSGGSIPAARPVRTGEDFAYEPDSESAHAAVAPASSQVAEEKDVAPALASAPTAMATPRWKELAKAGNYTDAIDAVRRSGVDQVISASGPVDLFALADAARLSNHPEIAEKSLQSLRRRFPRDPRAPRAAFDLGRLAFDQRHDYAGAATWFSACLAEDPNGPLDREAAGRLIEARKRAGDGDGSRAAARDYLVRYPDGPHAPLAKSIALSEP